MLIRAQELQRSVGGETALDADAVVGRDGIHMLGKESRAGGGQREFIHCSFIAKIVRTVREGVEVRRSVTRSQA